MYQQHWQTMFSFRSLCSVSHPGLALYNILACCFKVTICNESFETIVALKKRVNGMMQNLEDPKEQALAIPLVFKYDKIPENGTAKRVFVAPAKKKIQHHLHAR